MQQIDSRKGIAMKRRVGEAGTGVASAGSVSTFAYLQRPGMGRLR
jgi:hypothetical protein